MRNLLIASVLAAGLSTSALADNYDNTVLSMTAVSEKFTLSVKAPETGSQEYAISRDLGLVDGSITYLRNGASDDWKARAGKEATLPAGPIDVYAGGGIAYKWGDSMANKTLTATPYVGVSKVIGVLTPYAEMGVDVQSNSTDWADFNRTDTYLEYGTNFNVNTTTSINVAIVEDRSINFDTMEDRELNIGLTVKF